MWICIAIVYPVTVLLFRLRYRNGDRLPAEGPVLVVANHISVLDPLACARFVFDHGRLPHFLAKESVFTGFAGTLLRGAGQIPVARFSDSAHEALEAAKADLEAGNVVVIYPEGSVTRDPQWWPMQARTGVARLALTTDAVVLPVAQWGPQRVHDYHARKIHPRPRTPTAYDVGQPIDLSEQRGRVRAGQPLSAQLLRETTDLSEQRGRVRAGQPLSAQLLRETTDLIMYRVRDQLAELRSEPAPPTFYPRPRRELPGDGPGVLPGSAA
jgi:1-acyl-sn-glycerol-3-phosphate acyltransferase